MVVDLKIFEPNINNKTFSYWPVLCSLFQGNHERRQEGYTGRLGNITENQIGFCQAQICSPTPTDSLMAERQERSPILMKFGR